MPPLQTLHDMPFDPAEFPSPAQDDMKEPIDLAAWLIDYGSPSKSG